MPSNDNTAPTRLFDVVYYTAPWCNPCQVYWPAAEETVNAMIEEGMPLRLTKLDVTNPDHNGHTTQITSVPTIEVREGGRLLGAAVGAGRPPEVLRHFIENLIN